MALAVGVTKANIHLKGGAALVMMTDHVVITPTPFWAVFAVIFLTGAITLISVIPSCLAARLKPVTAMSHVG